MRDDASTAPSLEEVCGKSAEALIAEGTASWTAQKAAVNPSLEPWELVVFRPDPEVASILSRFADQRAKMP
ncbi:MAG: hypothetical protein ACLQRH_21370 [Acidimicrobiales bacterium]